MLKRKMLRDIKHYKIQFLSIFIMVFLGSLIYAGVSGEYKGIEEVRDGFLYDTNAADIYLYTNNLSQEDIHSIKALKSVKDVESRLILEGTLESDNQQSIEMNFLSDNKISSVYIKEGKEFNKDEQGIYLEDTFAKENNIKLNDKIDISLFGETKTYNVVAFIISPDYMYMSKNGDMIPDHKQYGFAYLSNSVLDDSLRNMNSQLLITTNATSLETVKEDIRNLLHDNNLTLISQKDSVSYSAIESEISQHKAMGSIFPVAFLAIAVLSVYTTMVRLLSNQRVIISTLKALGVKRKTILFHYLSYSFVVSLIGAILGAVIGPISLPYLFYPSMSKAYQLPSWEPTIELSFLILPLLLVLCCTIMTYFSARSYINEEAAVGMKANTTTTIKKSFFEKMKLWKKLGFVSQWNIRDILRSKMRSLMALVGILGCTGLLLCAFGMKDSLDNFTNWQFHELNHYETRIVLSDIYNEKEVEKLCSDIKGEQVFEQAIELKKEKKTKSVGLQVYEDEYKLTSLKLRNKDTVHLENGDVAISQQLAEQLHISKGDTLVYRAYGDEKWTTLTITKFYYAPTNQGIIMNKTTYESKNFSFKATSILTNEKKVKVNDNIKNIQSQKEIEDASIERLEMMNLLVIILVVAAVIMAFIVLYSLGVISYGEKYRDFATLKVLGFKDTRIRWILIQQNVMLSILAIPFGYGFGIFLLSSMMKDMNEGIDMLLSINTVTYIICAFFTISISFIVSVRFSKRILNIKMVEALKSDE